MTQPIASVIIPAHNEASVIGSCLQRLLTNTAPAELGDRATGQPAELELDIVVACNGCTDNTAAIARSFKAVRVIELDEASKTAALNAADDIAKTFPRVYVDADIAVTGDAIRKTVAPLHKGEALAAAPAVRISTKGCPWTVRAYYQIYQQLPWMRDAMIGSGVYALSEEGHRRLGRFPDVIAEDLVVARLFLPTERTVVSTATLTVEAPRTLGSLIRTKTRVATGNLVYRRSPPSGIEQHITPRNKQRYINIVRHPGQWPALGVYSAVYLCTRVGARWKVRRGTAMNWSRDLTTRNNTEGYSRI